MRISFSFCCWIILQIWGEPADGTLFVFQVLLIDDDQNDHDSQEQSNDSHDPDFEQLVIDDQHVACNSASEVAEYKKVCTVFHIRVFIKCFALVFVCLFLSQI